MTDDKKNLAVEVDRAFELAASQIKDKARGLARPAEAALKKKFGSNVFGRTFFSKLFKKDGFKSVELKDKLALIAAHRIPSEEQMAETIFRKIVQDDQSLPLKTHYDGFYRYWRHLPNEPAERTLRWGIIKIETAANAYTSFSHWSYDKITERTNYEARGNPKDLKAYTDPEDSGYVFYSHSKFFALGFRTGNIRLTIADTPGGSLKESIFTGIVLTTRTQGSSTFSAGFIMVHQDNPQFWKTMTPKQFREKIETLVLAEPKNIVIHT